MCRHVPVVCCSVDRACPIRLFVFFRFPLEFWVCPIFGEIGFSGFRVLGNACLLRVSVSLCSFFRPSDSCLEIACSFESSLTLFFSSALSLQSAAIGISAYSRADSVIRRGLRHRYLIGIQQYLLSFLNCGLLALEVVGAPLTAVLTW